MNRRSITCALLILAALVLAALALFAYLYLTRGRSKGVTSDPSYALITSPLNDAILFVGDPVYVRASAMLSHRDFGGAKLLVDGQEFALDQKSQAYAPKNKVTCTSEDARFCGSAELSLLWLGARAGRHSLEVCLAGAPGAAAPWKLCTDPASVVVTDLSVPPPSAGTYVPQAGDTVSSVAGKFGLPAAMVAADNPKVDLKKPLTKDTPLIMPSDPTRFTPSAAPSTGSSLWTVAMAKMSTSRPIDKAYCYYSLGGDYWTRVPAGPGAFAYPLDGKLDLTAEFKTLTIPAAGGTLVMECWGWSGATLTPLGSGKTTIVPASSITVHLVGDEFTLDVTLGSIPGTFETMDKTLHITPPEDLRGTNSADACVKHGPTTGGDSLFWALLCKAAVEKGDALLVWEWSRPIFPLDDPKITLATEVDGYHVYMAPGGGVPKLIKTISNPDQKSLDVAPFIKGMIYFYGPPSFFVRAYVGPFESADSNHYTLRSEAPGLATVTLDRSYDHYGGRHYTRQESVFTACTEGIGLISGSGLIGSDEMAVGYEHDYPEDSCVKANEEYSRAYVGYDFSSVKGPVSSATLSYRQGYSSAPWTSCARDLGVVTTDPSYDLYELLPSAGYTSAVFKVDVTSAVRDWMSGTPNNGFVFVGSNEGLSGSCGGIGEPGCIGGGDESCWTAYSGFQLSVMYFVP